MEVNITLGSNSWKGNNQFSSSESLIDGKGKWMLISPTIGGNVDPDLVVTVCTNSLSSHPTENPTKYPARDPTKSPVNNPTSSPANHPTSSPINNPTTNNPTTNNPTTFNPTIRL
eukprot:434850_1